MLVSREAVMNGLLAVAAGGAIGASLRYGAGLAFAVSGAVPWHTLVVNISGSFALGLLMAKMPPGGSAEQWRTFLGVGVLGGFTTFSTFSYEAAGLIERGMIGHGVAYAVGTTVACVIAAGAGYALGRAL
jgi:CrcB protein